MEFGPSFASVAATLEHSSQQQQQHREPLSTNDDDKSKSMMTNLNPGKSISPTVDITTIYERPSIYESVFSNVQTVQIIFLGPHKISH